MRLDAFLISIKEKDLSHKREKEKGAPARAMAGGAGFHALIPVRVARKKRARLEGMALPEAIRSRIEGIRRNRTSGAVELAVEAAEALSLAAGVSRGVLREAARAVTDAQPAMAPLFNLANECLLAEDPARACREFAGRIRNSSRAAAAHAAALIAGKAGILTHSYSATVAAALRAALEAGSLFRVIVTESRPMGEGVTLAEALGEQGAGVTLIVDAAMYRMLPEADLALTGADSVSTAGVVNKAGTALLALAAARLGVPFYTLCSTEKFLPAAARLKPETARDGREVLDRPLVNVVPANYYFDTTPLDLVAGIVTEEGVLAPEAVLERLRAMRVDETLAD
jgi:translation initiation factor 2B subunit (eIF-2B alpha/beta/delta family)